MSLICDVCGHGREASVHVSSVMWRYIKGPSDMARGPFDHCDSCMDLICARKWDELSQRQIPRWDAKA